MNYLSDCTGAPVTQTARVWCRTCSRTWATCRCTRRRQPCARARWTLCTSCSLWTCTGRRDSPPSCTRRVDEHSSTRRSCAFEAGARRGWWSCLFVLGWRARSRRLDRSCSRRRSSLSAGGRGGSRTSLHTSSRITLYYYYFFNILLLIFFAIFIIHYLLGYLIHCLPVVRNIGVYLLITRFYFSFGFQAAVTNFLKIRQDKREKCKASIVEFSDKVSCLDIYLYFIDSHHLFKIF